MPHSDNDLMLDRRSLLGSAILLVGGVLSGAPVLAATAKAFFTGGDRAVLDSLCDTMIPRTDTPGAVDAGVPAFLDALMVQWASPASQANLRKVVSGLGKTALTEMRRPFPAMPAADRTAWLARQDAALIAAKDPAYLQFKQLVLTAYYFSEAGATKELRYELVPGVWEPAVPVTAATRTWAA